MFLPHTGCDILANTHRAAIRLGAPALWMQSGIADEEVADLTVAAGIQVVMDRCIRVDHQAWQAALMH